MTSFALKRGFGDRSDGREVCGYLLVRGSVHADAYALALKKMSGVDLDKLLPTPNIWNRGTAIEPKTSSGHSADPSRHRLSEDHPR